MIVFLMNLLFTCLHAFRQDLLSYIQQKYYLDPNASRNLRPNPASNIWANLDQDAYLGQDLNISLHSNNT